MDFNYPYLLLLLPLSFIPWLSNSRHSVDFSSSIFLPEDSIGPFVHVLWCSLAGIAIASLLVALSGPGKSQTQIERIGRGAELSIVMDRSASMDANVRRHQLKPGQQASASRSKSSVVQEALSWLVRQRSENRYALTLFNVSAIPAIPFVDDPDMILAGLNAVTIGRGPNKTNMGLALLAAIRQFDNRSYSGSRAILLVSDGGAKLDEKTQQTIADGLRNNNISLFFIYIPSSANSPDLETVGPDADATVEEISLHLFFKGLESDYRVFQANDPDSMAAAVSEIDQQQNLPLRYVEQLPRVHLQWHFLILSLVACCLLAVVSALRLERLE